MLVAEIDMQEENFRCSFCRENKPTALWMGESDIYVCGHCASEILPQLMADGIVGALELHNIKSCTGATAKLSKKARIMERFHSAFSSALLRKLQKGLF